MRAPVPTYYACLDGGHGSGGGGEAGQFAEPVAPLRPTRTVRVLARLRPPLDPRIALEAAGGCAVRAHGAAGVREFRLDGVLGYETSGDDVFREVGAELVARALRGERATCLLYGQTGSGKSHTLFEPRGLVPTCLRAAFGAQAAEAGSAPYVTISALNVYADTLGDLLGTPPRARKRAPPQLAIRDDAAGEPRVDGLSAVRCHSVGEALAAVRAALARRQTASTALNARSSRSHVLLTAALPLAAAAGGGHGGGAGAGGGRMLFVDLAGSERLGRGEPSRTQLDEARGINSSLSALAHVVAALSAAGEPRRSRSAARAGGGGGGAAEWAPWRSCKLVRLLKGSLGGRAHTTLVCTLSPEARHVGESVSTLHFAERCLGVRARAAAPPAPNGARTADFDYRRLASALAHELAVERQRRAAVEAELLDAKGAHASEPPPPPPPPRPASAPQATCARAPPLPDPPVPLFAACMGWRHVPAQAPSAPGGVGAAARATEPRAAGADGAQPCAGVDGAGGCASQRQGELVRPAHGGRADGAASASASATVGTVAARDASAWAGGYSQLDEYLRRAARGDDDGSVSGSASLLLRY